MHVCGAEFARQIIANSNALGAALAEMGHEVRRANTGRWSENHQVHLITDKIGHYRTLYAQLAANGIIVNFDHVLGGRMFIRLGTQEITRRGMRQAEMVEIATLLTWALSGTDVRNTVEALVARYQSAHYSFDAGSFPGGRPETSTSHELHRRSTLPLPGVSSRKAPDRSSAANLDRDIPSAWART